MSGSAASVAKAQLARGRRKASAVGDLAQSRSVPETPRGKGVQMALPREQCVRPRGCCRPPRSATCDIGRDRHGWKDHGRLGPCCRVLLQGGDMHVPWLLHDTGKFRASRLVYEKLPSRLPRSATPPRPATEVALIAGFKVDKIVHHHFLAIAVDLRIYPYTLLQMRLME